MENSILRKRLSTFKTAKGCLSQVSDEVIMEVLKSWESWPGKSVDFYREIGLNKYQLANLIKKGKKLIKRGVITESEFKQIPINGSAPIGMVAGNDSIVMKWEKDKLIRFSQVDQLVDFLKKVA